MRFLVGTGRLAVLDLAGRYVHDELSALAEIAGTLRALSCHAYFFGPRASSNFVRTPAHASSTLLLGSVAPVMVANPAAFNVQFYIRTASPAEEIGSTLGPRLMTGPLGASKHNDMACGGF